LPKMVVRVFLLIVLSASLGAAQPTLPPEVALSQAVDIALYDITNIPTAIARLNQTSGKSKQWRSALVPHLGFEARQAYMTLNLAAAGIELPTSQGFIASGLIGPFASVGVRSFSVSRS
jgi:hypothetical protein